MDKIEELVAQGVDPKEVAQAWEEYVRGEVNSLLDIFLPESINGTVGVRYNRPVIRVSAATGEAEYDTTKATAVDIHIVFEFPEPVEFFEEKPE